MSTTFYVYATAEVRNLSSVLTCLLGGFVDIADAATCQCHRQGVGQPWFLSTDDSTIKRIPTIADNSLFGLSETATNGTHADEYAQWRYTKTKTNPNPNPD